MPSPTAIRRVTLWGSRGVRVGEAVNPGPEGTMADSVRPTQWESEAQFSLESRALGLTASFPEAILFDATECDLAMDGETSRNVAHRLEGTQMTVVEPPVIKATFPDEESRVSRQMRASREECL